jgi:hypothetical protein
LNQNASDLQTQQLQVQKSMEQTASLQAAEQADASKWNTSSLNIEKGLLDTKKSLDGLEHPVAIR